jgi:uncharacterized protein YjbI with pentapeptide repeats
LGPTSRSAAVTREGSTIKKRLLAICAGLGSLLRAALALTARGHGRRRTAVAAALVLAVVAAAVATAADDRSSAGAGSKKRVKRMTVEIVLASQEAGWRPGEGARRGRLALDGVAPRMVMMASAPRRELAVVPASLLGAYWNALFRRHRGWTNAVLSVVMNGRPRLHAVRLAITRRHRSGKRIVFKVAPLKRTAHRPPALGRKARSWEDATLLVDPTITDAIRALWEALLSFFGGEEQRVPPDPTRTTSDGGREFDNGAVYKGPATADISTEAGWRAAQRANLDGAGRWQGDLDLDRPSVRFGAGAYDGLALFNHAFEDIEFVAGTGERAVVTNTALFEVRADVLRLTNADVGGANMGGLETDQLTVENTLFDGVDMSGDRIGSSERGSTVKNAAFLRVTAAADDPIRVVETDFESVTFNESAFGRGTFEGATFQGCGFLGVDFRGAQFTGTAPAENGQRLEPTFNDSIMERVSFDGAELRNVSFANVDFSGGDVSLDGARLSNVDFTGATGLQFIDWTKVEVAGNVYGLEEFGHLLRLDDRRYLRTITFDGVVPLIDEETGFDIQPGDRPYLIDPATGVRLVVDANSGELIPIDPRTDQPMRDPERGDPLRYGANGELFNPETGEQFEVDYRSGELIER